MKAVLLAAGTGSRLRPLTNTVPKCLVPINGKPLIDVWLELLVVRDDIDEIFINVSYLAELVCAHLESRWSHTTKITVWHEQTLLGTAGTLKHHSKDLVSNDTLVIHADNLSIFSLDSFIETHLRRPSDCPITMMMFTTDTPHSCGIIEKDNSGRLLRMHEKVANPPGNLANAAVYIFSSELIHWISQHAVFDLSLDVIPAFEGRIWTWHNQTYHRDIGTPQSYQLAQTEVASLYPKKETKPTRIAQLRV